MCEPGGPSVACRSGRVEARVAAARPLSLVCGSPGPVGPTPLRSVPTLMRVLPAHDHSLQIGDELVFELGEGRGGGMRALRATRP